MSPNTTAAPITAAISITTPTTPVNSSSSNRDTTKNTTPTTADTVNARLLIRSQKQLTMTGNTSAPHRPPMKTNRSRMSNFVMAIMTPRAVAPTIVNRPINSIVSGLALLRARFLP